jgi:hypothetical protein
VCVVVVVVVVVVVTYMICKQVVCTTIKKT